MLWLNETREEIKKDNPGMKVTEVAKKAGELWRELKDKSEWEEKAAKDKERYTNEMKNYKPSGDDSSGSKKRKKESSSPKKVTSTTMAGTGFKSKEYISEDESSSGSDNDKKKKKKKVGSNGYPSFFTKCIESFNKFLISIFPNRRLKRNQKKKKKRMRPPAVVVTVIKCIARDKSKLLQYQHFYVDILYFCSRIKQPYYCYEYLLSHHRILPVTATTTTMTTIAL